MTTSRTITIFLASSDELINDRDSIDLFIHKLNDIYVPRGIRVECKRWEDFIAYCTGTRTQDDYNKVVAQSDICLCLFHRKAGKYTIEEFNYAMDEYKRTGDHPKTYVYARTIVDGEIEEEDLKKFKKDLFEQLGHYWCNYATSDSMKLHFVMQFERLLNGEYLSRHESNLKVERGNVLLHGKKIADFANLPFASENTEMKTLKEKIVALDKEIAEFRALNVEALRPTINAKLNERNECQKQLEQLEKQLLDMALSISKMISSCNPISERKRLAIEMFEKGNNKGVLEVLNETDIASDHERAKAELISSKQLVSAGEEIIAAAEQKIRSLVEELTLKAQTWMTTYTEPNRLEEACKCYESAISMTRESLQEDDLAEQLFKYGTFLQDNNQFHRVEEYYKGVLEICERLALQYPEAYESAVASTLNNLANLYSDTQRFSEAEKYYLRALEIRECLALQYPEAYEAAVASTLNNLAVLYSNTQRFNEAEKYYLPALEKRERLASQYPEAYEAAVASTLNNLANLYSNMQRFNEAGTCYLRALEIRERLASQHPEAYESDVASTLNNLAALYSNTQRFSEAEKYYLRALEIRERLALQYPEAYESDVASTLNNLALLYSDTQRFNEAGTCYLRALEIYERLASQYPEAYELYVATTLDNLANLYSDTQRFSEAEKYYLRALEIRERLASQHPEAYESDVASTLNNLAALYSNTQRFSEAETCYLRALNLYFKLAESDPNVYENKVTMTAWNLYLLYHNGMKNQIAASEIFEAFKDLFMHYGCL